MDRIELSSVYIIADIEGATGIWQRRQCHVNHPDWWKIGRPALTADINAVLKGLMRTNTQEITIRDVHDRGYNIITSDLISTTRYIGGVQFHPCPVIGSVPNGNAAILIAQHARSGSEGFFAHTMSGIFSEVRLDGFPIGEVTIFAAALGELGIPVSMISGDIYTIDESKKVIPNAKMVEIPKDQASSTDLDALISIRQKMQDYAEIAIKNYSENQIFAIKESKDLELVFRTSDEAKKKNSWGYQRDNKTLLLNIQSGYSLLESVIKVAYFHRRTWPLRRYKGYFQRRIDKARYKK